MSKIRLITRDTNIPAKGDTNKKTYFYKYEVTAPAKLFGKRLRKKFKTKGEANNYKLELETKLSREKLIPLNQDIHMCAVRFQKLLTVGQMEAALTQAVSHYSQSSMSLEELADSFLVQVLQDFEMDHVGEAYKRDIETRAPKLAPWLGQPDIRDVDKKMVEGFIKARLKAGAAPRTVLNYCRVLSAIMQKGVDEKLILENPVSKARMPKVVSPVHVLKPAELNKLIAAAPKVCKEHDMITPWLIFGAFAGLRSSETERLKWEDVRLDIGQLYVSPGKTENAERWIVLTPPLLDWCKRMLEAGATGLVLGGSDLRNVSRRKSKLRNLSGVDIPHNALRHSSHHLVHYDKPSATALEMGHHSPQMTFKAYRRAVTKVQAADYWDIRVEV